MLGVVISQFRRCCLEDDETVPHIVCECPARLSDYV